MNSVPEPYYGLVVPKHLIKKTKDALQAQGKFDKRLKVRPFSGGINFKCIAGDKTNIQEGSFYIPITIHVDPLLNGAEILRDLLLSIGIQGHEADISLISEVVLDPAEASGSVGKNGGDNGRGNLLARTLSQWLASLQANGLQTATDSLAGHHWTYTIYPPLLVLVASDFAILEAATGFSSSSIEFSSLYEMLCENFNVTHIALNAPIPANLLEKPDVEGIIKSQQHLDDVKPPPLNILRSPTGLTPLYGDFGPALPVNHRPTEAELQSAFWCTAGQNGIYQTWAPRYTMFSRGNVKEKARILELDSLTKERLGRQIQEVGAVDLYAGIGYFAFSYVKAGVGKVLCWEINPWSVEGLRRGAEANKWNVYIIKSGDPIHLEKYEDARIVVFEENNEYAAARIDGIRDRIPPVKHVNCGYLPSSKDSGETAVKVLDSTGGWIHAHENIAKRDIEIRKVEFVGIFQGLATKRFEAKVECEHVELVKSYAPGVMHCVLDIAITPLSYV